MQHFISSVWLLIGMGLAAAAAAALYVERKV
jgi:hypothetical protein